MAASMLWLAAGCGVPAVTPAVAQMTPSTPTVTARPSVTPELTATQGLRIPPLGTLISNACDLPAPTLMRPADGSILDELDNPRFEWSYVDDSTASIYQLSETKDFATLIDSRYGVKRAEDGHVISWTSISLTAGQTYFWRVASVCANGNIGEYSAPAAVVAAAAAPIPCQLPPPALTQPEDGACMSSAETGQK